uniref:Ankyrin repeat protein n=1 Tax=Acrobeloides nanus TaxID=290746 RepID=A0A914BXG9_9BILA
MDGPDSVVVHRPSKGIVSLNKVDASNGDVQQKIGKKHSFLHKMLSKILLPGVESRNKMNDTEFIEAIHKLNHFCDIVELILCGLVDYIGEFRNKNHRYTEYDEAGGETEDDIACAFLDRAQYPVFSYLYKESFQFYDKFKHETYSMVYSLNPKDIITEELMNRALFHLKEAEKESILEIKRFYARALTLSICLEKFNFFNTLQNMQISPYFSRSLLLFKKETIEKKLEENYYLETEEKTQLKKWTKQLIDFVDTTSPIIMKHKIMPTVQSNFYILSTNCLYESSNEDWYGKHDTIDLTNFGHCFHKYIKKPAIENVLNKQKALINAMDYRGYTPIFYTTFFDHIESFKGETILIVALKHRAIKCVEFLLNRQNHSHDIDVIKSMVSLADSDQNLPLHILLTFNSIHWVLDKLILDPTFQVLQQWTTPMNLVLGNLDGWIPFQLALVLREKICTPEVQAQIVERCLKIVTADKYSDEIVEKMLLSGIDVTKKYVAVDLYTTMNKIWENNNAMHLAAASKNSYRLLILLLKYAAKHKISRCIQDQENDSKMKPIDVAVRHASIETIKLLLKHFVFYNYNYRDIFSDVEQIDIKCDCYKYKKRARFPSGQLLEILSRPYPIKEEILKIMLETVYIPLDYNSYDSEKTAFDQAAENLNRECIQMFLDHKDWRNVMIRRTFHKESNSPFIAILQSMPEFLPKIFDKCIVRCEECKDTVYDFSLFEDMFVTKRPYLRATKGGISCSPFYGIYQKPHWLPVYNLCIEHVANEINIKNTPRICDFCIQRNQCSMCDKNAIEWDPSKILNDHQKEYLNTEQRESLAKAEFEYIPTHRDKSRCGELRQNHEIAYVPYRENALKKLAVRFFQTN